MVKAPKASAFGAFCIVLNENCEGKSAAESGLFRRNTGFTAAHGEDGLFHQFLQRPAKTVSAGLDHVTGASGGELLVLVFLFFRLLTSMSMTLLLGRIRAAAPIRPVSSSAAKRIFSIL